MTGVFAQHEFEKGDAIHRRAGALLENTIGPVLGIENVGHAALYKDWHIPADVQVSSVEMNQQRIIEMQGDGMHTDRTVQFSIDVVGEGDFWGSSYYVSLPGLQKLSSSQRRAVIATALSFTNAEYGFFSNDSWIQGGYKDPDHTPPKFRCDGLVEYSYEIALGHDWEPGNNGGIVPDDTYLTMWPALQYNYLTPRTSADKPIIVVRNSDGASVSEGDSISDNNVTVEVTDGNEGSGISRLEVWKGSPSEGGTEVESLRDDTDYNIDHNYSLNLPGGEIYLRLFDQAGNESLFNVNVEQSIDLVYVIDTTGSMGDDIAAAKAAAVDIVNEIDSQTDDYRVAVVSFEDFPYSPYGSSGCGDYMYHDVLDFSSEKSAIVSAIQSLTLRCGADWPESHYSALMHTFQKPALGGWRDNVKKVAVVMTDAPSHDPEPYTGYVMQDVVDASIALDPVIIYPIIIGGDSTARSYMETLAEATGGKAFDAANAGEVVEAIMEAIETTFDAPTADANGPYTGNVGSTITFDGSGSYDPDGEIVLYEWDFENDGIYDVSLTSPTATHTYPAEFTGAARLRVTDNDGLSAIDIVSVEVAGNQPPVAVCEDKTVNADEDCQGNASVDASSFDPDGEPITLDQSPPGPYPLGATSVTLTVTDDYGASDSCTATVTVEDTTAPVPDVAELPEGRGECSAAIALPPTATDNCAGTVTGTTSDPLSYSEQGTYTVAWTYTDNSGNTTTQTQTVVVEDTTPPELSITADPDTLWPPNHKMKPVTVTADASDNCDANPDIVLVSVISNEPDDAPGGGDGHTTNDIQDADIGTEDYNVSL